MPLEPSRGEIRDLLERARFLKQMGRAWDDGQFLPAAQLRRRRAVEGEHLLIALADGEQRGSIDRFQDLGREIAAACPPGRRRRLETSRRVAQGGRSVDCPSRLHYGISPALVVWRVRRRTILQR